MKREFLKTLGIEDAVLEQVMGEHGKTVEAQKTKLATTEETVSALNKQIEEANTAIESFKSMDIDGIKAAAEQYKADLEKTQTEYKQKLTAMEFDNALKDSLSGVKFSSVYAKNAVLSEIKSKGLQLQEGKILGLDDTLKVIKEADPDAFASDKPAPSVASGTGTAPIGDNDLEAVRAAMGLPPTK